MGIRSIEGVYDVLPGGPSSVLRSEAWYEAEASIRTVMQRFAFGEIRTPVLEPLELVARGIGEQTDIVAKEMFTLVRGRKQYVLRPEMTAPVMRAYLQHHMGQRAGDLRLFYMGPCFRAERPQKGRYRQFHQFGAEILGPTTPQADAEIIVCMLEVYREVGIGGAVLHINTLGDVESRSRYTMALRDYFAPRERHLSATSRERLRTNPLRILDTKNADERALVQEAPKLIDYVDAASRIHFDVVKQLLVDAGVTFVEDPLLVRGLDYYMRTAFELQTPSIGAQSALAGGGRYDGLSVSIGGKKPVPAVGFAAGMERLLLAKEAMGDTGSDESALDVFLVSLGEAASREVFRLALRLRRAGLRVTHGLQGRSIKSQMRVANRLRAGHAVIVGDEELSCKQAQVKDMNQGTQERVSFDALSHHLLSHHV